MFSAEIPAAEISTSLRTRVGNASASSAPMKPPIELPTTTGDRRSPAARTARRSPARSPGSRSAPPASPSRPKPGQVGRDHAEAAHERRDVQQPVLPQPAEPVQEQQRRAVAAGVDHVHPPAEDHLRRASATASRPSSRSSRRRRRTSGPAAARTNALAGSARTCPMNPDTPLPYQRPCASRSTSTRRCIPTGTSSPRSPSAASASSCPYETQFTWAIDRLEPEQLQGLRRGDPQRRARARRRALPRRGGDDPAPGTSRATSSTSPATAPPTRTRTRASGWTQIGLPHDELYCSDDKITRCVEIGIDVLIDDSPVNLDARASRSGSPPPRSSTRGTSDTRRT